MQLSDSQNMGVHAAGKVAAGSLLSDFSEQQIQLSIKSFGFDHL
jgi:hypothetical protein